MEKKLDGYYTRILRAILNKSRRQHPTKQQLYGYLPPISKTIKMRRSRYVWHCWRIWNELKRDVLLCTPLHGRAKAGPLARTYIQHLFADTGCSPEDLLEAMDDREVWRKRVKYIRVDGVTCSPMGVEHSGEGIFGCRSHNALRTNWGLWYPLG